MARRYDKVAAVRHHRGDADRLQDELAAPVRVPRAPALGWICRGHGDDGPLLRLQVAGIARCRLRPASFMAQALNAVAAGRYRAYSYIYIHLNS
jgi:hypothetical protein